MERVALVSREDDLERMLDAIASTGAVELDLGHDRGETTSTPRTEERQGVADAAVVSGPLRGLVGWTPADELERVAEALRAVGASAVPLPRPAGVDPPTLLTGPSPRGGARLLVDTYGTVPYSDIDPSRLAALSYILMFGIMFGDVGHGAILVIAAFVLRSGRIRRLASFRRIWPMVLGCGLAAMVAGVLYGEAFGPTGLVPVLWLDPLAAPIPLLLTALVVGAVLIAAAYTVGTINRVREGGWGYALYARTGVAGSLLFLAIPLLVGGLLLGSVPMQIAAGALGAIGIAFVFVGLLVESGGGVTGVFQAAIELVDTVIRLGSNLVSFARLAAFGLTHAALTLVIWTATVALWAPDWHAGLAMVVFVVGTVIAFGLEALVAGIQALRLEYYELFSRIFQTEGRPFRPWTGLPATADDAVSISSERRVA
jgi:V/A-type H+-transporting ATPase subunit I